VIGGLGRSAKFRAICLVAGGRQASELPSFIEDQLGGFDDRWALVPPLKMTTTIRQIALHVRESDHLNSRPEASLRRRCAFGLRIILLEVVVPADAVGLIGSAQRERESTAPDSPSTGKRHGVPAESRGYTTIETAHLRKRLKASCRDVPVILSCFARAVSRAASFTTQAASLIGRPASDRLISGRSSGSCGRSLSIP
jgi:hypothetical protein